MGHAGGPGRLDRLNKARELIALLLLTVHWLCDGGGEQTLAHWNRRVMRLQHALAAALHFPRDLFSEGWTDVVSPRR